MRILLVLVLVLCACGVPQPGEACRAGEKTCAAGDAGALWCEGGAWKLYRCGLCAGGKCEDFRSALPGDACPPTVASKHTCTTTIQPDAGPVLVCADVADQVFEWRVPDFVSCGRTRACRIVSDPESEFLSQDFGACVAP